MNILNEKTALNQYLESIRKSKILLIEGRHSLENLLYKDKAPDSERGILSIRATLSKLGIDTRIVVSTDRQLNAHIEWSDIVFIYAHGEFGEDGRLQGFIDYKEKKYPGSGVLASAICSDKVVLKQLAIGQGLRTPRFFTTDSSHDEILAKAKNISYPVMAKPRKGGSSIGIKKFQTYGSVVTWLSDTPTEILESYFIEEFIEGTFVTVGIIELGSHLVTLPPLRVLTESAFYDEETKLGANDDLKKVTFEVPAKISTEITNDVKEFAIKIFNCAQCQGLARVDIILDNSGVPTLLEINTIPGMSENSNFTRAFCSLGFTYEELVLAALRTARVNVPKDTILSAYLHTSDEVASPADSEKVSAP